MLNYRAQNGSKAQVEKPGVREEIRLWEDLLGNCDNSVLWIRNGGNGTNLSEAVSSRNLDIVWTGGNTKFRMI